MSFSKTEQFLDLARRAAATRQGITLDDVTERYEVSLRTAQRMLRAVEQQFPNTETWLDDGGRKRWRIPGGYLREFFSITVGSGGIAVDLRHQGVGSLVRDLTTTNQQEVAA